MNPRRLTDVMCNFGSGVSAMFGIFIVYTVCTFNCSDMAE